METMTAPQADATSVAPETVAPITDKISAEEIAALRAQAAADLAENTASKADTPKSRKSTAKVAPAKPQHTGATVNANSIRQTIITALLAGEDTKTITATLVEKFPGSAAASKSVKHIAYYRSHLRKEGRLPKAGETATGAPNAELSA